MNGNQALIEHFYSSFARADVPGMLSCYHPDIEFEDPAFGRLKGEQARNMWRMLVKPGLQLTFSKVWANETNGGAHWVATYTFSKTGRKVVNRIAATFEFKDGKIIRHKDVFNMWKWSAQALGLPGLLLGWTPFLKQKIRNTALEQLKRFA